MKTLLFIVIFALSFTSCKQKQVLENVKATLLSSEFIFTNAPFAQCHASTVVETDEGLLAAWFGGTREKNKDVCIYISHLKNNKWSTPQLVADGVINDTLRYPCWNPVLFEKKNGDIVLYYKVGPSPREWWGLYKTSSDNGKTWSEAVKIPDNLLGPIKNKPKYLSDGTILYPTSFETKKAWTVYVEKSDSNLKNWRKIAIDNNGFNAIQPTILFYDEGKIQLLCRSKEHKIVEIWSDDNGETWTPMQASSLVNNNSGIDGVTSQSGLQLLVCNPVKKGRHKLSVLASYNGKTWKELIVLENQKKGTEFSYPAIIEGRDGTFFITYTYNRETVKYIHLKITE